MAVGEIGLDFFVAELNSQELRQKQEWFYQQQLIMAREFNLPVLLHIRKSQDRVLKYLRSENIKQGIAHAFNGSLQQARQFLEQGFKLGFGGAMTWNRALQIRRLAAELQNDSIVLETDSPDIPPSWLAQNEHNTPEQIPNIANELAQLRACDLLELSAQLFQNTLEALPRLKKLIASDVFESR